MKIEKEFFLIPRPPGRNWHGAPADSGLRGPTHMACGLLGMDWWPARAAHKPVRPAQAQRPLSVLEHARERSRLARHPAVHTQWSIVA
jgi:hypothetical protein